MTREELLAEQAYALMTRLIVRLQEHGWKRHEVAMLYVDDLMPDARRLLHTINRARLRYERRLSALVDKHWVQGTVTVKEL